MTTAEGFEAGRLFDSDSHELAGFLYPGIVILTFVDCLHVADQNRVLSLCPLLTKGL